MRLKAPADDHIIPLLPKVWTIPFPRLIFVLQNFGGGQRIMMGYIIKLSLSLVRVKSLRGANTNFCNFTE